MDDSRRRTAHLYPRRRILGGALAGGAALALRGRAQAQAAPGTPPEAGLATPAATPAEPFSFDVLSAAMQARAGEPYEPPQAVSGFANDLTYDQYRRINFRPERARWADDGRLFRLQAFHLGWLYDAPVGLYEVVDGVVRPLEFSTDDFDYGAGPEGEAAVPIEPGLPLPGVSGFRLNTPLNQAGMFDELVAFQGASYFRALGRGNAYGLSARGLAIDTATGEEEEFPTFTAFYAVRPAPGERTATIYAALDSESVTGAYRFVITPGRETVMDVTARLYFRRDVAHLGLAPLTSMFLYAEANRSRFDDYRPQVHDSSGLRIRRASGDVLWRALANPPRLATSYFAEAAPLSFGLHQRDREFADYQDLGARYQDRPSVEVDLLGDWGVGAVRLVEIPSDLEVNDNIVAYWAPRDPVPAGSARSYDYRLRWGMLEPEPDARLAYVLETRTGLGGVSGVSSDGRARKFVIDFRGGRIGELGADAPLVARLSAAHGEIVAQALSKVEGTNIWRLVADIIPAPGATMELVAFIEGYDERLSETWLYQWIDA